MYVRLTSVVLGEPEYMKLRKSYVARLHKFSEVKNPREFYFSELQLYHPFTDESLLFPDDLERCKALYDEKSEYIQKR